MVGRLMDDISINVLFHVLKMCFNFFIHSLILHITTLYLFTLCHILSYVYLYVYGLRCVRAGIGIGADGAGWAGSARTIGVPESLVPASFVAGAT